MTSIKLSMLIHFQFNKFLFNFDLLTLFAGLALKVLDAMPFKIFEWLATLNFMRCFITLQLRFEYLIFYWIEKQNYNNNVLTLIKTRIDQRLTWVCLAHTCSRTKCEVFYYSFRDYWYMYIIRDKTKLNSFLIFFTGKLQYCW